MKSITKIRTEDTGKMFEMGLCMALGTRYDGPYKYGLDMPTRLQPRLKNLCSEFFPKPYLHTAKRGARYDYTCSDDPTQHFSAKSIKKGGGKVAPQVIGQATPAKFCSILNIPFTDVPSLKVYIQENIPSLLGHLVSYTFDCPNVYFNEQKDTIQYVSLVKPIDWSVYQFEWTCPATEWNNSSTLKIKRPEGSLALVEFQFHTKSRSNMAIRWCYETFLQLFKDHLFVKDF